MHALGHGAASHQPDAGEIDRVIRPDASSSAQKSRVSAAGAGGDGRRAIVAGRHTYAPAACRRA